MAKFVVEPGADIDGFTLGECVHRGGMATLWSVSRKDIATPLLMKIPRVSEGEDPAAIVSFDSAGARRVFGLALDKAGVERGHVAASAVAASIVGDLGVDKAIELVAPRSQNSLKRSSDFGTQFLRVCVWWSTTS